MHEPSANPRPLLSTTQRHADARDDDELGTLAQEMTTVVVFGGNDQTDGSNEASMSASSILGPGSPTAMAGGPSPAAVSSYRRYSDGAVGGVAPRRGGGDEEDERTSDGSADDSAGEEAFIDVDANDAETRAAEKELQEDLVRATDLRRRILHGMLLVAATATAVCGVAGTPVLAVLIFSLATFRYGRIRSLPLLVAFIVACGIDIAAIAVAGGLKLTDWGGSSQVVPASSETPVPSATSPSTLLPTPTPTPPMVRTGGGGLAASDPTRVALQAAFSVPWTLGPAVMAIVAHVLIIVIAALLIATGAETIPIKNPTKNRLKVRARMRAAAFVVATGGAALSVISLFALPFFICGLGAIASVPTAVTKTNRLMAWQSAIKRRSTSMLQGVVALYTVTIAAELAMQSPALSDETIGIDIPHVRLDGGSGAVPTSAVMAAFQMAFAICAVQALKSFIAAVKDEHRFKEDEREREALLAATGIKEKILASASVQQQQQPGQNDIQAPTAPRLTVSAVDDDDDSRTHAAFKVAGGGLSDGDPLTPRSTGSAATAAPPEGGDAAATTTATATTTTATGAADSDGVDGAPPEDASSDRVILVLGYLGATFRLPFGIPTVTMAVAAIAFPSMTTLMIAFVLVITLFSRTTRAARTFQTYFGPVLLLAVVVQYIIAALVMSLRNPPAGLLQAARFMMLSVKGDSLWQLGAELGVNSLAAVLFIAAHPRMPSQVVREYAELKPTDEQVAAALKVIDGPVAREMCMWAVKTVKMQESGKDVADVDLQNDESGSSSNRFDAAIAAVDGAGGGGDTDASDGAGGDTDAPLLSHSPSGVSTVRGGGSDSDEDDEDGAWNHIPGLFNNVSSSLFKGSFASNASTAINARLSAEQRRQLGGLRQISTGERYTIDDIPAAARVVIFQYGTQFAEKSALSPFRLAHTGLLLFQSWVSTIAKVLLVVTLTSTSQLSVLTATLLLVVVMSFFPGTQRLTARFVQPFYVLLFLLHLGWWPSARAFDPPSHFTEDTSSAWSLAAVGFRSFDTRAHCFEYVVTLFVLAFRSYVASQRGARSWQRTFDAFVLWTNHRLQQHPLIMAFSRVLITATCGVLFLTRLVAQGRNVLLLTFCTLFFLGIIATVNRFFRVGRVIWAIAGLFSAFVLVAASAFQVPPLRAEASRWFESCGVTTTAAPSPVGPNGTTAIPSPAGTTTLPPPPGFTTPAPPPKGLGGVDCGEQFGLATESFALALYLLPWIIALFAAAEQIRSIHAAGHGPRLGVSVKSIRKELKASVFTSQTLAFLRTVKEKGARIVVVGLYHSRWAIIATSYILAALSQRTLPMCVYLVFFGLRLRGAIPAFVAVAHFVVLYTYQFDFVPDLSDKNDANVNVAELCGLVKSRVGEAPYDIAALTFVFAANCLYTFVGHVVGDFMRQRIQAEEILKSANEALKAAAEAEISARATLQMTLSGAQDAESMAADTEAAETTANFVFALGRQDTTVMADTLRNAPTMPKPFKAFANQNDPASQKELRAVVRALRIMADFHKYEDLVADAVYTAGYEFATLAAVVCLTVTYHQSIGVFIALLVLLFVSLQNGTRFQTSRFEMMAVRFAMSTLLLALFVAQIAVRNNVIDLSVETPTYRAELEWFLSISADDSVAPFVGVFVVCCGMQLLTTFAIPVRERIHHHSRTRSLGALDLREYLAKSLVRSRQPAGGGNAASPAGGGNGTNSRSTRKQEKQEAGDEEEVKAAKGFSLPCWKSDAGRKPERVDLLVLKVDKVRELLGRFTADYLPLADPPAAPPQSMRRGTATTDGGDVVEPQLSRAHSLRRSALRRRSETPSRPSTGVAAADRDDGGGAPTAAARAAGLGASPSNASSGGALLTVDQSATPGPGDRGRSRAATNASSWGGDSTFRVPRGSNALGGSSFSSRMSFFSFFTPPDEDPDIHLVTSVDEVKSGYFARLVVARFSGMIVTIFANVPLTGIALIIFGAITASFYHMLFVILGLILEGNRDSIQIRAHYWWPRLCGALCLLIAVVPVVLHYPAIRTTLTAEPVWMQRAGFVSREDDTAVISFSALPAFVLYVTFMQRRVFESFKYARFLLRARLQEYHRKRQLEGLSAHVKHEEDKARHAVQEAEQTAVRHVEKLREDFGRQCLNPTASFNVFPPPGEPKGRPPPLLGADLGAMSQSATSSMSVASPMGATARAQSKELQAERKRIASRFAFVDPAAEAATARAENLAGADGRLPSARGAGSPGRLGVSPPGDDMARQPGGATEATTRGDTRSGNSDDGDDDGTSTARLDEEEDEEDDDVFSVRCRMRLATVLEKVLYATDNAAHHLALISLYPVPLLKPKAKADEEAPGAGGNEVTSAFDGAATAEPTPKPHPDDDDTDSNMSWVTRLLLPLSFELMTVAVVANAVQSNSVYDVFAALFYFVVIVPKYRWPAAELLRGFDWYIVAGMLIKQLLVIAAPTIRESGGLRRAVSVLIIDIPVTGTISGAFGGNADILLDFFVFFASVFRLRTCIANGLYATAKDRRAVQQLVSGIADWTATMARRLRHEYRKDIKYALSERADTAASFGNAESLSVAPQQQQQQGGGGELRRRRNPTAIPAEGEGGLPVGAAAVPTPGLTAAEQALADAERQRQQHQLKLADLDRARFGVAIGRDFQFATIFIKLLGVLVFAFGYFSIMAAGEGSILSSVEADVLPGPVAFIFLLLFLGIILERYVYLRGLDTYKTAMHFVFTCLAAGSMTLWGAYINRPSVWSVAYEVILWTDVYVSALQVKNGFPRLRRHNPWADKPANPLAWAAFLIETKTPFLLEARMAIDYAFTRTTLSWESWGLVEELRHLCFERSHRAAVNADRKLGDFALVSDKVLGAGVACLIMVLLLLPLMLFSTFNPFLRSNMVTNLDSAVKFSSGTTIYRSTSFAPRPVSQASDFLQYLKRTRPILGGYLGGDVEALDYQARDVQLLSLDECSEDLWPISDAALASLGDDLDRAVANGTSMSMPMALSVTRQAATGGASTVQDLAREWAVPHATVAEMRSAITAHANESTAPMPMQRFLSPFVFNQPSGVKFFPQVSNRGWRDDVSCYLSLHRSARNTAQSYWCVSCDPLFSLGNVPNGSYPEWECLRSAAVGAECTPYNYEDRPTGAVVGEDVRVPMYYVVVSDRVPTLLDVLPNLGIIVFYTTFVLAAGQILRSGLAPRVHRAYLSEIADPHHVLVLISAIAAARLTNRFEDEQRMYLLLVDLIRDPTLLAERTKRHIDLYDANKKYIGGTDHDAKSRVLYTL